MNQRGMRAAAEKARLEFLMQRPNTAHGDLTTISIHL